MPTTSLVATAYLQYLLTGTSPFGTNTLGPASLSFTTQDADGLDLDTWDEVYAEMFVIFAKTSFTADTTDTSTTISNLSSMTGLAVGMCITGTGIPVGARITVVGASTITISAAATATGAGVAMVAFNAPISLTATIAAGGTLADDQYFYAVTATGMQGDSEAETYVGVEANATTSGANKSVTLSWTALTGATGYKIYRGTVTGTYDKLVGTITSEYPTAPAVTFTDDGTDDVADTPPVSQPDNYVEFDVQTFNSPLNGAEVIFTKFLQLMLVTAGSGAACRFAAGTTNGLDSFFSGTTPALNIPCPGCQYISDGADGDGWTIDATHKTFRLTNYQGTAPLVARLAMIGSTV